MVQDHLSDQFVAKIWDAGADEGPEESQVGHKGEEWDEEKGTEGRFERVPERGRWLEEGEDKEGHEERLGELIDHEGACEDKVRPEVVAL